MTSSVCQCGITAPLIWESNFRNPVHAQVFADGSADQSLLIEVLVSLANRLKIGYTISH